MEFLGPLVLFIKMKFPALGVAVLIFARLGAVAFLTPGLGERFMSARIRLGAALAMTWVVMPIVMAGRSSRSVYLYY